MEIGARLSTCSNSVYYICLVQASQTLSFGGFCGKFHWRDHSVSLIDWFIFWHIWHYRNHTSAGPFLGDLTNVCWSQKDPKGWNLWRSITRALSIHSSILTNSDVIVKFYIFKTGILLNTYHTLCAPQTLTNCVPSDGILFSSISSS